MRDAEQYERPVDLRAIAHAYASGAEEYARKFGDDLVTNQFDRAAGYTAVSIDLTLEMLFVARSRGAAEAAVRADVQRLPSNRLA